MQALVTLATSTDLVKLSECVWLVCVKFKYFLYCKKLEECKSKTDMIKGKIGECYK